MQLFKTETIPQFRIHQWLVEHGLQPEAIDEVAFPDFNQVRITDENGDWALFTWDWETGAVFEDYGQASAES